MWIGQLGLFFQLVSAISILNVLRCLKMDFKDCNLERDIGSDNPIFVILSCSVCDYRQGLDWWIDLQVVTTDGYNTVGIFTLYSSLENIV
jgi:hypothetical protein